MEIKDFIGLFSLAAMVVTALWAYTKYFLERGFLPPTRFFVTLEKLGRIGDDYILDIKIHLNNIGSSTLIARNIRLDLRYLLAENLPLKLFGDTVNNSKDYDRAGRLIFPNSVIRTLKIDPSTLVPAKLKPAMNKRKLEHWRSQKPRGFLVLEHDTFIQAEVDQVYTFVTKVPKDSVCCLAWCSFQYAQEPKNWQKTMSRISRKLGLIQYTLEHVQVPHTVEDVFWIAEKNNIETQKNKTAGYEGLST